MQVDSRRMASHRWIALLGLACFLGVAVAGDYYELLGVPKDASLRVCGLLDVWNRSPRSLVFFSWAICTGGNFENLNFYVVTTRISGEHSRNSLLRSIQTKTRFEKTRGCKNYSYSELPVFRLAEGAFHLNSV